ncbi:MAG: hypothetical protein ACPG9S_00230 [Flavobacteriales bacterium]
MRASVQDSGTVPHPDCVVSAMRVRGFAPAEFSASRATYACQDSLAASQDCSSGPNPSMDHASSGATGVPCRSTCNRTAWAPSGVIARSSTARVKSNHKSTSLNAVHASL